MRPFRRVGASRPGVLASLRRTPSALERIGRSRALSTSSLTPLRIAVYPGDGIGVDVTRAAFTLLEHAETRLGGFKLDPTWYDWNSGDYYDAHGKACPDDMVQTLRGYDAVFLGAVGWPERQPDHITLEPLIRMRQAFDLFACMRPARTFAGVPKPLARGADIDMLVVRENSEGEYAHAGGRLRRGEPSEVAVQTAVHTRRGVERALRFGFERARGADRRGKLTMVTKSNAQAHSMTLWDDVLDELVASGEYGGVAVEKLHVDAAAMDFVRRPDDFDVVVASNLFGDILTDLSGAVTGSLGLNPSANLDPTRANPSLFEPVHGSAPDIAGLGIANPVGASLSAALMPEWLRVPDHVPAAIRAAVEGALAAGESTRDAGGSCTTEEATDAIIRRL